MAVSQIQRIQLTALQGELATGLISPETAIISLASIGFTYSGPATVSAIEAFILNLLQGGSIVPVAPAGNVLQTPPACTTKAGHKGICCAAVTQFCLAQAAAGFRYTSCTGRQVCLACGTKVSQSTNPSKQGTTVFSVKRVSCGVSGCPALSQLQGQIINPA